MSTHVLLRIYLFFLFILVSVTTAIAHPAADYHLSGIVRDSLTLEPLPYASVTVSGKTSGTLTDGKGMFELTVADTTSSISVNCLGYDRKAVKIKKGRVNLYDITLTPAATQLQEVVIHRNKYSKKNNPAVELARRLRENAGETDPRRNDYYNFTKHRISTIGLNDFGTAEDHKALFKRFPFLWEFVDTSEVSGKPVLNLVVKETTSDVHYRRQPQSEKEVTTGSRQEGIDEMLEGENLKVLLDDVLREIDLYDNDINLLSNRFVSPLSRIAPDFYRFYLTDTVKIDTTRYIVLSFYPRNKQTFGFNGQLYVPLGDPSMFIKKVTMRTPRDANVNFVENLFIEQEFEKAPDGSRLKVSDNLTIEASIIPGKPSFYIKRNVAYADHNFNAPTDITVFDHLGRELVANGAERRDSTFWNDRRLAGVTHNERRISDMMKRLRSVPIYYWSEKFLKIMFSGYVATGRDSKFDYGPVNTSISFNPIEGARLRAGGMTTANLSRRWFGRGYTAYGVKDHRWKYGVEAEYSFHDKKYHSREFPIHSLRLSSLYDVDMIGQHYEYTNSDNMFLSLKRLTDYNATYHNVNKLEYTLELTNNFSVLAKLQNERQFHSPYIKFIDGNGRNYGHYTENSLSVELRYAPGEKFAQTKSYRIPVNPDVPVLSLTHTFAPRNFLNTDFPLNKTEISLSKRFWLSAFGYIDAKAKGGIVWSRSPFINLFIPNANLSYTIQRGSFALMNPMEFVNDSYTSLDFNYFLNGALFNYIPLIKKLKWREVVTFRGLWGHLSHRNDPTLNPELFRFPDPAQVTSMSSRPYMEVSAGIENIFKVLRVDYVWRLSYLDVPYEIDRRGLRIAVHVKF